MTLSEWSAALRKASPRGVWWSANKVPTDETRLFVQSLTNVFILNLFKNKVKALDKKIAKPTAVAKESKRKLRNKKRMLDIKAKQAKEKADKKAALAKKEALYKLAKGLK